MDKYLQFPKKVISEEKLKEEKKKNQQAAQMHLPSKGLWCHEILVCFH